MISKLEGRRRELFLFCIPVVQFILFESFISLPFMNVYPPVFGLTVIFIFSLDLLAGALVGHLSCGYAVTSVFLAISGFAMAKIQELRGVPFQLSDFRSIRTAMSVAKSYNLFPSGRAIVVFAGFAAVIALCIRWRKLFRRPFIQDWRIRLAVVAACVVCIIGEWLYFGHDFSVRAEKGDKNGPSYGAIIQFETVSSRNSVGTFEYLAGRARLDQMSAPDGYEDWTAPVDDFDVAGIDVSKLPDVVVVMDEAFSDPGMYAAPATDQDMMPFIHSFSELPNARLGTMSVSVLGGNTANTELEFLAGTSMSYFSPGSVPYSYAIDRDIPSMARYFSELGYETWAIHPYYASGWNRDKVYEYMGFENMLFLDMARDGVSFAYDPNIIVDGVLLDMIYDSDCYETVMEILNKQSDRPKFVFLVTVYNHGGYGMPFPNLERTVKVSEETGKIFSEYGIQVLETYMSLMAKSDREYREFCDILLDRADSTGRDTLTLFFGDHQPDDTVHALFDFLTEYSGAGDGLCDQYTVPYGIWATYDLPEELGPLSGCACYAGIDVFDAMGIPCPGYYDFLREARDAVPVLTGVKTVTDGSDKADEYIQEIGYWTWDRICAEK